ncbi:MAG: hypothetical protein HY735_14230 [Verrucomicrobia bacterium]|nr:hypothetical protein [Verrucomicrobiota bacterium]
MSTADRIVVLAPDFFADAFMRPAGLAVLQAWREGQIRPVVHRELLIRYFKVFRRLGLSDRLIRWWGWWLTSPDRTRSMEDELPPELSARQLCETLAQSAGAQWVICSSFSVAKPAEKPSALQIEWLTAEEFVRIANPL